MKLKLNPKKVKVVEEVVEEESYTLTLDRNEMLLIYGVLGATGGSGKWADIAGSMYNRLNDMLDPVDSKMLDESPYGNLPLIKLVDSKSKAAD